MNVIVDITGEIFADETIQNIALRHHEKLDLFWPDGQRATVGDASWLWRISSAPSPRVYKDAYPKERVLSIVPSKRI